MHKVTRKTHQEKARKRQKAAPYAAQNAPPNVLNEATKKRRVKATRTE
jgi:hypothetical protein